MRTKNTTHAISHESVALLYWLGMPAEGKRASHGYAGPAHHHGRTLVDKTDDSQYLQPKRISGRAASHFGTSLLLSNVGDRGRVSIPNWLASFDRNATCLSRFHMRTRI